MSKEGVIFSWGSSNTGALGLGKNILNTSSPKLVETVFKFSEQIKSLHCGTDCSMILMENGGLFACGRNNDDKIGLGVANNKVFKFVGLRF